MTDIFLIGGPRLYRDAMAAYISELTAGIKIKCLKSCHDLPPGKGLALFDCEPGKALKILDEMRKHHPLMKAGFLVNAYQEFDIEALKEKGSVACFLKSLSGRKFRQLLTGVLSGARHMPSCSEGKNTSGFDQLTNREKQVLGKLAQGKSNKEIARELKIEVVTVKLHVRGICRKLEVQNRMQAALAAQGIRLPR